MEPKERSYGGIPVGRLEAHTYPTVNVPTLGPGNRWFPTGPLLWTLVLLAAAGGVADGAGAQEPTAATVQGVVVDADTDRPIAGAAVVLESWPDSARAGASRWSVSDDLGRYVLSGIPPGRYRLRVSGLGYRDELLWLEVPTAWRVRQSVGLSVSPLLLAPLEIRLSARVGAHARTLAGPRPEAPSWPSEPFPSAGPAWALDVHRLSPGALPGTGALGEPDVLRALRRLPGVSSRGDFSATVWVRGAPWGLAPVLLDGLPLYDPLHLGGVATALSADALGEVALLPGVLPASASSGAAGAVVLGTARARQSAPVVVAATPLALRLRAEDRWMRDRVGLAVSARRSWWDYVTPDAGDGDSSNAMDYHFADLSARADLALDARTHLDVGALWEEDRLEGSIRELVARSRGTWGNRTAWIALGREVGPVSLRARWGRARHEGRTRPFPWFSFATPDGVPVLQYTEASVEHRSLRLEASGHVLEDRVRWRLGYESVLQALAQDGLEARERDLPGVDGRTSLGRGMAWTEAEAHLGPVRFAGGLALDLLPDGAGEGGVRPSARLGWAPLRWLSLEAASGTSRQFIYPLAPAGTLLGPGLAAGHVWVLAGAGHHGLTSTTHTLSARAELAEGVTVRASLFRRRAEGFWMDGVAGLAGGRPAAAAEGSTGPARGRGPAGWRAVRRGRMGLAASYSRLHATFSNGQVEPWPSPAHRPHALDLALDLEVGRGLQAGLDLVVESGWPVLVGPTYPCPEDPGFCVTPPDGVPQPEAHSLGRAPGYASLDLRVAWEHATGPVEWTLDAGLRNLLGRENAAAYRVGTCPGAELISAVCERPEGMARFEPGLVSPTPSVGLRVRF